MSEGLVNKLRALANDVHTFNCDAEAMDQAAAEIERLTVKNEMLSSALKTALEEWEAWMDDAAIGDFYRFFRPDEDDRELWRNVSSCVSDNSDSPNNTEHGCGIVPPEGEI